MREIYRREMNYPCQGHPTPTSPYSSSQLSVDIRVNSTKISRLVLLSYRLLRNNKRLLFQIIKFGVGLLYSNRYTWLLGGFFLPFLSSDHRPHLPSSIVFANSTSTYSLNMDVKPLAFFSSH